MKKWRQRKKEKKKRKKMKKWKTLKNEKNGKMKKRKKQKNGKKNNEKKREWKNEKKKKNGKMQKLRKRKMKKNDEQWKNEEIWLHTHPRRFPGFTVDVVTFFVEILYDFHDFVSECVCFPKKINNPFWGVTVFRGKVTNVIGPETNTHIFTTKINEKKNR